MVNQQDGQHEARHWDLYDSLPLEFRRLLQFAPESYQAGWVHVAIKRMGAHNARDQVRREISLRMRRTILKFYGPTHPQLSR